MSNETHKKLNEALICERLCGVTDNGAAWVLLQEPGFIGFGVVQKDKICLPPGVQPDWARVSDLRLFGERGEWHVWEHWNGNWQSRLLELQNINDSLTEYHALWGNDVKPDTPSWVKLVEDRGTEIWLPLAELALTEKDLPLRLKLKQVVGYDNETDESSHLAGIIDAALVALVNSEKKVIPPSLSSCP